jgi:hypothetical protein
MLQELHPGRTGKEDMYDSLVELANTGHIPQVWMDARGPCRLWIGVQVPSPLAQRTLQ